MKEVDITMILRQLNMGIKKGVERNTILKQVIAKIQTRMDQINEEQRQRELELKLMEESSQNEDKVWNKQLDKIDVEGPPVPDTKDVKPPVKGEDNWLIQNALKVNRIKDNLNNQQRTAKSAGEIALRFMGINKEAFD